MKYTVLYTSNGDVLAVVSKQSDLESLKIGTFEVPDGHIIDSIDVSGKEHTAATHATPMADMAKLQAELEATNKRFEELDQKRSEETAEMRAAILASATMIAAIAPPSGINEEEN